MLALASITAGTLYQKRWVAPCDVRTANTVQLLAALRRDRCRWRCWRPSRSSWHPELIGAMAWSVLVLTLGGSSLLYLLIQRGAATAVTQPDVPGAALHGAAGLAAVRRDADACACSPAWRSPPLGVALVVREPRAAHDLNLQGDPMSPHRIAVIAGDGIGKEVMPEGLRVLDAAARRFGIALQVDDFDFANCDYFARHGKMMPDDWKDRIGGHDAIFFGAVGWPATVPDHVSLWGSLLKFRRDFDQYVNLRPARLMPGIRSPLVNRQGEPLKPGDIDMWIVRENTEGEYSSIGGRMYEGTEREIVMQETVMSRIGVDRVLKFAFELAQPRPRRKLTSATKSNGISITMPYWDERVEAMAKALPARWRSTASTSTS